MKVLTENEMKVAAKILKGFLPHSQQMYGHVFLMNRLKSDPKEIIVDTWPDFNTILCRAQIKTEGDLFKDWCIFSKDEDSLRKFLAEPGVINREKYICLATDLLYENILRAHAEHKGIPWRRLAMCYLLKLQDISDLPALDSLPLRMSALDESHVDLVNKTWKFGHEKHSLTMIRDMIRHFPTCCLWDKEGHVVAWILTYSSGAMGMLYTMPEHRGKGYAKILISSMSRRLQNEGYPVFCFVEEENKLSYRLFKSLGFTEDPAYREAWFIFNYL